MSGKVDLDTITTTDLIKDEHVNTYYSCMLLRQAKSVVKGQEELKDVHIETQLQKIEEQKAKIESLEQKLSFWRNMKLEAYDYLKGGPDKSGKAYQFRNGKVSHSAFKKVWSAEEFEWYTEKRIKQLKSNLYNAKNKLNRLYQKLANMQNKIPVICFGGKAFFKKQFTVDKYVKDHDLWRDEFYHKRHHHFVISGNENFVDGSKHVRYNRNSKTLSIMSHKEAEIPEGKKYAKSEWFTIPCEFKYREAEYLEALDKRNTMAYEIFDYGEYFIIKAVFEYDSSAALLRDYSNGVNGIDINIDRFALVETDKRGNLLKRKVIYFNLDGLSSNQATKVLENAVKEVGEFCKANGKPLVREHIETIKFKNTGDHKRNKQLTQFAYDKMINIIDRRLEKDGIMVYKVNPAYTSQQGKIKYMAAMGMSVHESAAYCIARRFQFSKLDKDGELILFYEDLGKYNRFGKIKAVSKQFARMSRSTIYRLHKLPVDLNQYRNLSKYVTAVNNYIQAEQAQEFELA
ncbi:IS200/IS605 family accessory protein TnpB-related protein [Phocaeicola sp.]|uniref:IS200/IS605 family accessory protein TnpB-related protein n=1 Tax=Phocaeicola sp. TaxID=2773926 RepID=UPI00386A9D7F